MILTLEALNAEEGDCLLLHHGSKKEPLHILIDGGPRGTYAKTLGPRLKELRKLHGLLDAASLSIELGVLTHTDSDHLDGLVALFEELRKLKEQKQPLPFRIESLWYNTFDDLVSNREVAKVQSLESSPATEVRAFAASVQNGRKLRDIAKLLVFPINQDFDTFAMQSASESPCIEFDELSLTVLSPTPKELTAIEKAWDTFLKSAAGKKALGGAAAFGDDDSPTNLSSIVVLAEAADKRLLLTGDARADQILTGLQNVGLLPDHGALEVDVLKIPHHGSSRNSTLELYQRVHAQHYVVSANGEYGNPDRATLDMLWQARGKGNWTLWTTFPQNAFQSAPDGERRETLRTVQQWIDSHEVKVHYRNPNEKSIRIELGADPLPQ